MRTIEEVFEQQRRDDLMMTMKVDKIYDARLSTEGLAHPPLAKVSFWVTPADGMTVPSNFDASGMKDAVFFNSQLPIPMIVTNVNQPGTNLKTTAMLYLRPMDDEELKAWRTTNQDDVVDQLDAMTVADVLDEWATVFTAAAKLLKARHELPPPSPPVELIIDRQYMVQMPGSRALARVKLRNVTDQMVNISYTNIFDDFESRSTWYKRGDVEFVEEVNN